MDKAGATDAGLDRMERFTVYRVRFQVANTSTTDLQLSPRLQTGDGAEPVTWQGVPEQDPKEGIAFYAASDAGRAFRARSAAIDPAALRLDAGPAPEYVPTEGVVSAGLNPAPKVNLPARSFTEIVFAVRATVDAKWTRTYAFRLEPGAETVAAGTPVLVTMRSKPPIVLTVPDPKGTATGEALGYQLAVAVVGPDAGPAYPLAPLANPNSPHIASNITSDGCVACHGGHESTTIPLLSRAYRIDPLGLRGNSYDGADFGLCLACHQESPYADLSGSANPFTVFPGHGFHLGHIPEKGVGGVQITVPGDGQGNALCAECHYNLHGKPASERGLVLFAPNVQPFNGRVSYDVADQSCTLTCHGREHDGLVFDEAGTGT